ncbi:MAG: hypothetical protein ACLPYS_15930, partial [Vulcanimicrobiaceae bacterium]
MGTNLQDDETAEATRLFGKNVADSTAMIPAGAAPHSYVPNQRGTPGSHAISGSFEFGVGTAEKGRARRGGRPGMREVAGHGDEAVVRGGIGDQ